MKIKRPDKTFDPLLAASWNHGDGTYIIRGSQEWDQREWQREKRGCLLLSYGTIYESDRTNGRSSGRRMN